MSMIPSVIGDMKVIVYVDESYLIKSTQSECPRGEFKCSHAAALFIHAINSISVTDVECSWKSRRLRVFPHMQYPNFINPEGQDMFHSQGSQMMKTKLLFMQLWAIYRPVVAFKS
eukprot:gene3579-12017_t